MVEGAVAVVEDADAIPELWILLRGGEQRTEGEMRESAPLGLRGGTMPVGRQSRPSGGRPA